PVAAALLIAPLLVGVVGADIWRATFAALVQGTAVRGVGRLGMMVGVAFALGQSISLSEAFSPYIADERAQTVGGALLMMQVGWAVLLGLVLAAFFRWISAGASTWLDVAARHFSPRQTYRIGLAVGSSILAVWLSVLFELYGLVRWTGAILADPDYWEQV